MKTLTTALCTAGLFLGVGILSPSQAQSADNNGANQAVNAQANGQVAKKTGRDPVAAAFQLPSGTVLNKQQRAALDDLKADKGPELRDAFDVMAQAQSPADRANASKDIRSIRAAIRSGIDNILSMTATPNNAAGGSQAYAPSSGTSYGAGYAPNYYAMNSGYYSPPGFYGGPYGATFGWAYGSNYGYGYGSGYWPYGHYRRGSTPYYYSGKSYGTVNQPVKAKLPVNKPVNQPVAATNSAVRPASGAAKHR